LAIFQILNPEDSPIRQYNASAAKQARTQQLKQTAAFKQYDDGTGSAC